MRQLLDSPRVLFWVPTLIWASTWHVILYQLAEVAPLNSVAWRFGLAGVVLLALAAARGEHWLLAPRWHGWLVATGVVQYSLNYWAVYEAERHVPSGLVAVLFSLMVFGNALLGWRVFGQPVTRRFIAAAVCGVVGVALIFWPELVATGSRPDAGLGLGAGLLAVTCACIGNVMTLALSRRGLPLVPMLGWSMAYGALALWLVALAQGTAAQVGTSVLWWGSLLYLALAGSVVAFFVYFRLAQRVGPARAAMTGVTIPPIALAISTALEGWRPNALSWLGILLSLGSVYVATRRSG
ncbi:MAG: DMT family transporter [Burkholderiaceae bacterium]